ncbi:MAG: tetratricopeptide repeat protein [Acidobacteriota bacterium]|nr:tetratricopeptide repeat protein [Acidobacteriota bacterium]
MTRAIPAFLLLLGQLFASDSIDRLRQALTLFNSGNYQDSFNLVSQYVQENPDSPTGHKLLGMDEFMLGHSPEALAEVKRATELAPNDPDARYYLGRLYFSADKAPAALEAFKKTIALDPSSVRAHNQLGETYEALGLRVDAESAYRKAIELEKDQPKKSGWPDYNLGVLCLDDGRTADAIDCFRRALQLNPKFPEAKIKLAVAISKNEPVPEAFELLQDAINLDPRNPEAHYRLALLLSKSGKREEAQEQFALFQKYRKP